MEQRSAKVTEEEVNLAFLNITKGDIEDIHKLIENRPLLAHYTSICTVENIIKSNQLWFSNPLFMNDLQEMRFGINEGLNMILQQTEEVKNACGSEERAGELRRLVKYYYDVFDEKHALDVYIFCLSEHQMSNDDGLLSMWRAYGGRGNGAALIFNTDFINFNATSPLIVTKVKYKRVLDRFNWLKGYLSAYLSKATELSLPDDQLYILAFQLFNLIKIFGLTFKHDGFSEEQEWRVIYMPDRDVNGVLKENYSYHIGNRGVEPKLKFPIGPLDPTAAANWSLETILEKIILGPSVSSPLAKASICRMLDRLGKAPLIPKVVASTIPLRPEE